MHRLGRRTSLTIAAATASIAITAGAIAVAADSTTNSWPYADAGHAPVLAAVGDIGCEPNNAENASTPGSLKCDDPQSTLSLKNAYAVADQIEGMKPQLVALLGDEQYEVGKLSDFQQSFDKTYGAFKFLQRPAPGNHEYYAYTKHGDHEAGQNGTGYFSYYNGTDAAGNIRPQGQAGDYNKGWYSYDLGHWHIVSLNAECNSPAFGNSCDPTSGVLGQETAWLAKDLAADHSSCTLAYWHQPTFTSTGAAGTDPRFASDEGAAADAWWKLLYRRGADVVLNGHEHVYARFQPMDPNGNVDTKNGLTQFIVGTGGEDLDTLSDPATLTKEHVVTGQDTAFGAMKLTLGANGYSWDYRTAPGGATASSYQDQGTASCHGQGGNGQG